MEAQCLAIAEKMLAQIGGTVRETQRAMEYNRWFNGIVVCTMLGDPWGVSAMWVAIGFDDGHR